MFVMRNFFSIASAPILSAALATGCANKPTPHYPQVQETVEQFAKRVCNTLGEGEHVSNNTHLECHEFVIYVGAPYHQTIDMQPKKMKLTFENAADYVRDKKVVVAGEEHRLKNDNEAFIKLLPIFKQQGFTDLGIELDIEWQKNIDEYYKDGDDSHLAFLDKFMGGEGDKEIIRVAKTLGLRCTCIDVRHIEYYPGIQFDGKKTPQAFWDRRDQYMFENVEKILQTPDRRMVCFNGVAHATYSNMSLYQSGEDSNGPLLTTINQPLGYRLRKKYGQDHVGLIDLTGCDEYDDNGTYACFERTEDRKYYE